MAEVIPIRRQPAAAVGESTLFEPTARIAGLINGGEHLDHDPVFADDEWDLAGHPAWKDKAGTQTRVKFGALSPRWRTPAKELALLQLSPHLAPQAAPTNPVADAWPHLQEPVGPGTAQGNIKALSHALATVEAHQVDLTQPESWERLTVLLRQPASVEQKQQGVTLSGLTARARAQQLLALWQIGQIGGHTDLLGEHRPWGGRDVAQIFRKDLPRNSVRPHEHVGHVLGFVAWFFDNVAENVIEHIEWWAANSSTEPPATRDELFEEMHGLLADLAARNGGALPASSRGPAGKVTLAAAPLARLLGVYDADEAFLAGRWAIRQFRTPPPLRLGITPCPVPIKVLPTIDGDELPWTATLLPSQSELDAWQRRLVYYGMYYLAATVMLRDSQLATLPLDPVKTETIQRPNGASYTRHVLSAFKTKNRHAPTPTSVTVNARVVRIIELLQRLHQALGYTAERHSVTGLPYLFDARLAVPLGKAGHANSREGIYLDLSFLTQMTEGAAELHQRGLIARDLSDTTLSMRQVRITCAQAYSVREHGQALAAAFGQWDSRAVAQGYIGDVYRLITPIEPGETRDLTREDIGRRMAHAARKKDELTGNGLRRMEETAERHRDALSNPDALTPARLKTLGKNNPNIEQGPLTICIFQPEGALCGGKGKPDFRLCLPGQCRNSVMTRADRARYEMMRRQHLALHSPVLRRAADKMHDANPQIAAEFTDHTDDDLAGILREHVDDYVRRSLEGRS